MKISYKNIIISLIAIALAVLAPESQAFTLDTYATQSKLASGRWVKVSVTQTGIHFISASTLRQWGFSNPAAVTVHGYGGGKIADYMTADSYIDDLPATPMRATDAGIYFYAKGPVDRGASGSVSIPVHNPYSNEGYYYLSEGVGNEAVKKATTPVNEKASAETQFTDWVYHAVERTNLGSEGTMFVGEDFLTNKVQTFSFTLPGLVAQAKATVWCRFVARVQSKSSLAISGDGALLTTGSIYAAATDTHGRISNINTSYVPKGENTTIELKFTGAGVVSAAALDALSINYMRKLQLAGGKLSFRLNSTTAQLGGATASTHVWDITNLNAVQEMNTVAVDGGVKWTNAFTGQRDYVAWNEGGAYPSPAYVGVVANQNLHGDQSAPDMVIFTVREWLGEANRLANFHRNGAEKLKVVVAVQDDVFNEFSSGTHDPAAFRKMLKMYYDRGKAEGGNPLKFATFFGRSYYDYRRLTGTLPASEPILPAWMTEESMDQSLSISSDDVMAMLEDNSGKNLYNDIISIAVGRLPARNLSQAKALVDKITTYVNKPIKGDWKNSVIMAADNGNTGQFMEDSEAQIANIEKRSNGSDMIFTKVYIDAFTIQGGRCIKGRERLHRKLDEGVVWLNYIGHGSMQALASEGILTFADMSSLYNKHWPLFFAATCSFGHSDGLKESGAESILLNTVGGAVGVISPCRKAAISDNSRVAAAMGNNMMCRDENGKPYTVGQMLMHTKNDLKTTSLANVVGRSRLGYSYLGDPALRLATPASTIELESVNGDEVLPDGQTVIMAKQRVTLRGSVKDYLGSKMSDFNGEVHLTLYDAEYSTTSKGLAADGTSGKKVTFEEMGSKLYMGRGRVVNGDFEVVFSMPSETSQNFRPATLNMYAIAADGREAQSVNRDLYVFGYDDDALPDEQAPVIEYAYLNHQSYREGQTVNESPMFFARVRDDVAINLSTVGVGHQMIIKIDDTQTFGDVSLYYEPSSDGTPSGTITYPIGALQEGYHTLAFRVWDTSGNSATHTTSFFVEYGARPEVYDIYTDANPATEQANFYITHNRPDAEMTVGLDIYDMMGHRVWSTSVAGRSDMFVSAPITWDLCDQGGRRVSRGIYIYRATLKMDGHEIPSKAKRIAVSGR